MGNTFFACNSCLAWPCKKWYRLIDVAVTLGDTSLTEKSHLMEEIIDSICINSHSARSLIKYNLVSSVSNIGFRNQIPKNTYSRYNTYLAFQSHVGCDLNAVINAVPLLIYIKI